MPRAPHRPRDRPWSFHVDWKRRRRSHLGGFFLAIGTFDHVIVSALHLLFGVWLSNAVDYADLAANIGLSTLGDLVGGLLLVTFTHTAQVKSE